MRDISIKAFQANIKANLKDIPLALTRRGKVVAYVVSPEDVPDEWRIKEREREHPERKSWRVLRYEALRVHGGKCLLCGRSPREHGIVLHVDHIKPSSLYPDLEFELDNLQVLCDECNMGKSNKDTTDWRSKDIPELIMKDIPESKDIPEKAESKKIIEKLREEVAALDKPFRAVTHHR